MLWYHWWNLVCDLRSACARTRTFLWMSLCLAGLTVRKDLRGVTSIVRALGLEPACYDRLLDFFHSSALDLDKLTGAWCALVFRLDPGILRVNGRPVLVGDGIKVAKASTTSRRPTATASVARSRPTIATSNLGSSPKACCRFSPRRNPRWSGSPSARGSEPFARDWHLPNRLWPLPSAIPSRNFSPVPPNPPSS